MKNPYQHLILCIVLLAGLSACEPKPLELDIKMNKPKIIINPFFNNGNRLGVLVTRSFSALESPEKKPLDMFYGLKVDNAKAYIENNGKKHELLNINPAFISEDLIFKPYSEYSITVKDTVSGETVKAATTMLPQVSLDEVTVKVSRQYIDTVLHVKLTIRDAGTVKKYYLATYRPKAMNVTGRLKKSLLKKSLYEQIELFDNSRAVAGKFVVEKKYHQTLVAFGSRDSLVIDVSEVSEAYYKYLEMYKKSGTFINQLTGEPINLPSNVQGGAGFFFLLYPAYRTFDLERF